MKDQLTQYVKLLFAATADSEEMQQEILQNTLDRYDDLIAQGKSPEAAYRLAIAGIGDINELLQKPAEEAPATTPAKPARRLSPEDKKLMQAVAIGMYICCVIPVIALSNISSSLGVGLMFVMIAAATVLIILGSDDDSKAAKVTEKLTKKKRKTLSDTMGTISLILFFILSFATGAWYITWLIFPIIGAIEGVINAILDLKEGRNHED